MRPRSVTKSGKLVYSEDDEHIAVADWLRLRRLFFIHVPNEGKRSWQTGKKLKRMGVVAGAPDFMIFSPPKMLGVSHVALELKALDGKPPTREQIHFLEILKRYHWETGWFRGADAAIDWLRSLYD